MVLITFLNNLFKKDGFLLEDGNGKEHIIGKPASKNLILKLPKPVWLMLQTKYVWKSKKMLMIGGKKIIYLAEKNCLIMKIMTIFIAMFSCFMRIM